jgi:hypothetical protein
MRRKSMPEEKLDPIDQLMKEWGKLVGTRFHQ